MQSFFRRVKADVIPSEHSKRGNLLVKWLVGDCHGLCQASQ